MIIYNFYDPLNDLWLALSLKLKNKATYVQSAHIEFTDFDRIFYS